MKISISYWMFEGGLEAKKPIAEDGTARGISIIASSRPLTLPQFLRTRINAIGSSNAKLINVAIVAICKQVTREMSNHAHFKSGALNT